MSQINLPFEVGQVIEAKSFEIGYRGAWFRCEVLDIFTEEEELIYKLKYVDYTEEEIHDTKVFQKPPGGEEDYLMVRPTRPPHYHESDLRKIKRCQEPLLVIHESWKIGDLVDWWFDDCYWSGKVLKVMKNKAQVKLFPKPIGEGKTYQASLKDLCPSLEWSLEDGWKVPSSKDGEKRQCAKLIKHNNEGQMSNQTIGDSCEAGEEALESALKELKSDGGLSLNIMESDAIEAAVYDLEELIARIEWLKGMLKPDVGEGAKPYCWTYADHRPSSTRM